MSIEVSCVISFFYIKPQLRISITQWFSSCVISFFYIKPQLILINPLSMAVVLYLSSTSNHNCPRSSDMTLWLCYIFLLHQTTTSRPKRASCCSCVISFFYIKPQLFCGVDAAMWCCVISFFYIKPQLWLRVRYVNWCCVISFFYIKPQLVGSCGCRCCVVLYLSSTSNHNRAQDTHRVRAVVLYLSSTSNHNHLA